MDNRIINKQISIEQIVEVAKYLEKINEKYQNIFEVEKQKNEKEGNRYRQFGEGEVMYSIQFTDGKTIKENGFNWFISNLNQPKIINDIVIHLKITFFTKKPDGQYYDVLNSINVRVDFRQSYTKVIRNSYSSIDITTTHQENEAHIIESDISNILNSNEDRYNKTIKNRQLRIQSFCICVGLIVSYILFLILKINPTLIPETATQFFNKYIVAIGQWFLAIVLGNLFGYWYIISLYNPILPWRRFGHRSTMSSNYSYYDDIEEYKKNSEVQFGQYWDAKLRRDKIEKIFKICKIIILVQAIISLLMIVLFK